MDRSAGGTLREHPASIDDLQRALAAERYIADRPLAVAIFLALTLRRPLFLEGEAGVGKTEVAKALAAALGAVLIRLQCYEGLDISHAVYEWDYARQLLEIRLLEAAHALERETAGAVEDRLAPARAHVFSDAFLIKRPLLQALESADRGPTVLLIDEIDRADEEFEGYLLELLSDFQVTIPEVGTFRASHPPVVVLTSNRTREVHDALKRRCLYAWIDYPDFDKELRIVTTRLPHASEALAEQATAFVQELRRVELYKVPGVSETLDWAAALAALGHEQLDASAVDETLGLLLKYREDLESVRGSRSGEVLARALTRGVRQSG